jgi:alpha-1,2-mannosyltransferase
MTGLSIDPLRRADWLNRPRLKAYATVFLSVLVLAAVGWLLKAHGLIDPAGHPVGADFLNVYAAGLMANAGHPADVYDWAKHAAVEHSVILYDGYFGWHYPPMFLFFAEPLAWLSYRPALVVYLVVTFAAYLVAMGRLGLSLPHRYLFAAALPAVFVNLGHGQNGFLTTALTAGGLALLTTRPIVAGVLFGLLAYKPQFAVLIPVALLAGGYWPTIASAAATAIVSIIAAYLVFGAETWAAFFQSLEPTRTIILEQGATGWQKIVSVFSAVRMWGGSISLAYGAQAVVTLAALILIALVWRRCKRPQVAIGMLALATPLTTPYVLDYDLVISGIAVFALSAEGRETGFRPWEKFLLALVTVAPLVARGIGSGLHLPIVPPILIISLVVFARRAFDAPLGK